MKDTVPDAFHTAQVINTVKKNIPHFEVYAGYDNNFAHNILSGGDGCIGGLSNIVPEFLPHGCKHSRMTIYLQSRSISR